MRGNVVEYTCLRIFTIMVLFHKVIIEMGKILKNYQNG